MSRATMPTAVVDPRFDPAPGLSRFVRSLAVLAAAGASLALAAQLGSMGANVSAFAKTNDLSKTGRSLVLVTLAGGAAISVVLSSVIALFFRGRRLAALESLSRLEAPLVVTGLLPPLLHSAAGKVPQTDTLIGFALVVLLLRVTLEPAVAAAAALPSGRITRALDAPFRALLRPRVMGTLVGVLSVAFAAYFTVLAGAGFRRVALGSPQILLGMQAVFAAAGAFALFVFARGRLSTLAAGALACAFLCYAPLHGALLGGFQWLALAPLCVFGALAALDAGRTRWAALSIAVLLLSSEASGVGTLILGTVLWLSGEHRRFGVWLAVASVLVLGLVALIPAGVGGVPSLADGARGAPSATAVMTLAANPPFVIGGTLSETNLVFVLHLLVPLAFLPVSRVTAALLVVPGILLAILPAGSAVAASAHGPSIWHLAPYLFVASVLALVQIARSGGRAAYRAALMALVCGATLHGLVHGAFLHPRSLQGAGGKNAATQGT